MREWIPTQEEMFNQAMKRPRGYHRMMPWEQWNIDADLGILDWDGGCPHEELELCKDCLKKYKGRKGK